jgi:outer membrane autotransporter protein
MKKKSNLKIFLATASAFAMITGASSAAMGNQVTDNNGGNVVIGGGADANTANGAAFVNGDSFHFSNAGHDLTTGGAITINAIDLNNQAPGKFTVAHNTSVGPITDTGGANTIDVIVNDGLTLILENNPGVNAANGAIAVGTFNGVGDIELGSGGAAGTLTINSNATLGGAIDSNANAADGIVNVNAGKVVTFNGIIGGAVGLAELNALGNGSVINLGAAVKVATVKVANAGAQVNINGGNLTGDVSFTADGTVNVAAGGSLVGNLVANADGDGKVQFAGAGEIKGTIGNKAGNGIGLVEANGAGIVTIGAGDHKAAFEAANAGASFKFADAANITGTIDNKSGAVNNTALTFEGSSIVTGNVGATNDFKTINLTGGADKTVQFEGAVKATNLNIGKAGQAGAAKVRLGKNLDAEVLFLDDQTQTGELEVFGAAAHNITGDINKNIGADESRGKIIIANDVGANAVTFKGQIGDTANKKAINHLHILNNNAGGSVILEGGDVHIEKIQAVGAGSLKLNEANAKYKFGEIVVDADNVFALEVDQNVVLTAPAAGSVNFGSSGNGGKRLSSLEFTDNKTLTIENGVNIYAAELNKTVGNNNRGTFIFAGDSIFSAKSNGQNIKAIEVNADKTATLLQDIKTHEDIKLLNNATLVVAGNVTTDIAANGANHGLIGVANGNGHLKFVNSGAVTVTGNVGGAANALQSIEFNNGNVQFKSAVIHTGKDFKFTGQNESIVTFDKAGFGDANFVNDSNADNIKHTVVLSKDEIFTGRLAVDNPATKQIAFDIGTNDTKATLRGGVQANGASFVNKGVSGRGTLELNEANLTIYSAGTNTKKLKTIELQENATITNGVSADTIAIKQGKIAVIGGEVSGTNFNLENAGSTVKFLDGGTLKVAVTATTANQGIVEFQGGGGVETGKGIGTLANRVKTVTFSDDATKTLTFGSSVFASEKIDIGKGTFKTENNNVILNAPDVNAKNASFDLGPSGKITVNGGNLTFSGENGKVAVKVAQSGNSNGQIIAGTGSTLKYEAGSKITITPDDSGSSNRLVAGETNEFAIIKNDTGRDVIGKLNVAFAESKNSFTKWSSRFDNDGTLILTQKDAAADKIKEILEKRLDTADKRNIDALTQAAHNTDAYNFVNILQDIARNQDGKLSDSEVQEKVDEAYKRLISTTAATDSIENTMNNAAHSIGTRLVSVSNQPIGTPVQSRAVAGAKVTGVSAGDDPARYGAWFSPFFSKTTQKARKGSSGYRDATYGGSFGMDTKANDDLIIGGAMTFANSETKYKNLKSGDRTKVNSLMFSIYALQQITDTWFAQGSATIGSNEVKNLNKRVPNASAYQLASSKYNAMSFVGDVLFGYNYAVEGLKLTPMGGVRYTRVNSAGYKETGTTSQNLDVSQKASNKLEVVIGARVSGGTFEVNGMSVTPEVRGFINHDIIGKTPKQDLHIGGAPDPLNTKSSKPINTSYNLGVGVTANYGMMEYGAGYDVHLADKRVGHEGSLKVRVNF